jgi:hypothetical protein
MTFERTPNLIGLALTSWEKQKTLTHQHAGLSWRPEHPSAGSNPLSFSPRQFGKVNETAIGPIKFEVKPFYRPIMNSDGQHFTSFEPSKS